MGLFLIWQLDLSTGRVIGIDFGHAFGSATYQLPVPELMGVRLTRQARESTHFICHSSR